MDFTNKEFMTIGVNQQSFPQYLFKYRADNSNTKKILTKNELWFCNPLEFNDPYDCNTPINTTTTLEDIKKWLLSIGVFNDNIDFWATQLKNNPNILSESTKNAVSEFGICCFSTLEDSILQWSHYSDYHKGVCFKFDITVDPDFFMFPLIVSYRNVMQHYNHLVHSKNIIDYLIRPKFSMWSYESEIRIIKSKDAIANNGSRAFKFKNDALKEIIFGTNASNTLIAKYKKLCKLHGKSHVKFYKMELANGFHYGLTKKELI